jgi:hypothetical protein
MTDDDTDTDDTEDYSTTADPVLVALELCRIASNPKTIASAVKRLRRLDRQYSETEAKCAALAAQAQQTATALEERAAELAAREAALDARETAFAVSIAEARDNLRQYHDSLAQEDRRVRYRILSHADLLHGYNSRLQDLPDWPAIKQMIPGLPADLPAAPAAEVITSEVREDWAGNVFVPGSSLTRTVRGAA